MIWPISCMTTVNRSGRLAAMVPGRACRVPGPAANRRACWPRRHKGLVIGVVASNVDVVEVAGAARRKQSEPAIAEHGVERVAHYRSTVHREGRGRSLQGHLQYLVGPGPNAL